MMKVLAGHYRDYESIGTLYSRASGKLRFVEIELVFPADRALGEIEELSEDMERALAEELPGAHVPHHPGGRLGVRTERAGAASPPRPSRSARPHAGLGRRAVS